MFCRLRHVRFPLPQPYFSFSWWVSCKKKKAEKKTTQGAYCVSTANSASGMESKQPQITCDEPAVNISGKLSLLQQVFTHYIIHIYIIYYIYIYIYSCLHLHNVHIAASKYSLRERARLNNSRCGVCVCPHNGRHRSLKPLVFFWSWAPLFIFFFFCYEAVTQHALQKVLSKRLGAGAEFVKKSRAFWANTRNTLTPN